MYSIYIRIFGGCCCGQRRRFSVLVLLLAEEVSERERVDSVFFGRRRLLLADGGQKAICYVERTASLPAREGFTAIPTNTRPLPQNGRKQPAFFHYFLGDYFEENPFSNPLFRIFRFFALPLSGEKRKKIIAESFHSFICSFLFYCFLLFFSTALRKSQLTHIVKWNVKSKSYSVGRIDSMGVPVEEMSIFLLRSVLNSCVGTFCQFRTRFFVVGPNRSAISPSFQVSLKMGRKCVCIIIGQKPHFFHLRLFLSVDLNRQKSIISREERNPVKMCSIFLRNKKGS